MTQAGYALVGLTAIVAMLVGVMTFALLRFSANARDAKRHLAGGSDATLLSAALQDAVTRLKAQEQAMSARARASEQLSGQIVESLTAGLLVVDAGGLIEILNPAGRTMLGLVESPVGRSYHETLAAASPLARVIRECLSSADPIVRQSVETDDTGGPTHLGVSVSPLGHGSGGRGVICLFSDLTPVFELEAQLRLKETLAQLGELTAGIAHEFRNGLATIHGYSRLIDPASLPAPYRPYVEGIRQETEVLGHVVTNFLNFARPELVTFRPVDLEAVVRRAVDDLNLDLPADAALTVEGTFGVVQGDEVVLKQVFSNLLRNAAEACESAGVTPVIVVEGQIDSDQRSIRVCINDNGPGIPEADRERVFRPFVSTRSRGTGLGLAIVQKLILMHNGRVSIAAAPAGGASIRVVLPAV